MSIVKLLFLQAIAVSALGQLTEQAALRGVDKQQPEPAGLSALIGHAPSDRAINPGSAFDITASSDDSTATIKASLKQFPADAHNIVTTLQAVASAPLSKSDNSTAIATAQGFPDSFSMTAKYVGYQIPLKSRDQIVNGYPTLKTLFCDRAVANAVAQGKTQKEADDLNCDSGTIATYLPEELDRFDAFFWDTTQRDLMWGASTTLGYRQFNYLQTDATKTMASRTPWGASAFFGIIPRNSTTLLTGGLDYRRKYKDSDTGTICPATTGMTVQCKTGSIGAPKQNDQKLAYIEIRRLFKTTAASLKAGYDAATHHWSTDVPIYVITTPNGTLGGGIRASWEQTKHWQFGVFVSSFSLFPF